MATALVSVPILVGCNPEPLPPEPRTTLIFYDRSASSKASTHTSALFTDSIQGLIRGALSGKGDAVRAFLVHAHTPGKAYRRDFENTLDPDTINKPAAVKASNKARYQADLQQLRSAAQDSLLAFLNHTPIAPQHTLRTDLLGTLEVASEELPDSAGPIRIYYFGDMHESMVGAGRRDFDARPPKTVAEAQAWADQDTAVIQQMGLVPSKFKDAELRVLRGDLANQASAPQVKAYWLRLFKNAGFNPARVRFL